MHASVQIQEKLFELDVLPSAPRLNNIPPVGQPLDSLWILEVRALELLQARLRERRAGQQRVAVVGRARFVLPGAPRPRTLARSAAVTASLLLGLVRSLAHKKKPPSDPLQRAASTRRRSEHRSKPRRVDAAHLTLGCCLRAQI